MWTQYVGAVLKRLTSHVRPCSSSRDGRAGAVITVQFYKHLAIPRCIFVLEKLYQNLCYVFYTVTFSERPFEAQHPNEDSWNSRYKKGKPYCCNIPSQLIPACSLVSMRPLCYDQLDTLTQGYNPRTVSPVINAASLLRY